MFYRSPLHLVAAQLSGYLSESFPTSRFQQLVRRVLLGVSLAWALIVPAMSPRAARAADGDSRARPPEILSWRHQVLNPAEYEQLAGEWETFVAANPKDARALVEWGDALRYSGKYEEAKAKYRAAFETDSLDAAAVEAYSSSIVMNADDAGGWKEEFQRLRRSLDRNPGYPQTCYMLWSSSVRAGDQALADRCLRAMFETGDMPRPLLEVGENLVEGAPPGAIVLTNGDNDTYPPLAYQVLSRRRPDVTIANLSLLNTIWYIRYLKGRGLPITLTDAEIAALQPKSPQILVADQIVEHLAANLTKSPTRTLLYSVTVPQGNRCLTTGACQGLLVPVTGGPIAGGKKSEGAGNTPCNWVRTRELLDTVYRTEGVLDPLVDWKRESAVVRIIRNYVALECGVADWLVSTGQNAEAGGYYLRAVRQLAFHHDKETATEIIEGWAKADPRSNLLSQARQLLER